MKNQRSKSPGGSTPTGASMASEPPLSHPTALERARSTGRGGYLDGLPLQPRPLVDAVGNQFDPDAINIRWGPCIREWLARPVDAGMQLKTPTQQFLIFQDVRGGVQDMGLPPAVADPFPKDIRPLLMAAEDAARRARAGAAETTAPS